MFRDMPWSKVCWQCHWCPDVLSKQGLDPISTTTGMMWSIPQKGWKGKAKFEVWIIWELLFTICLWCWASERLATVVIFCILLWKKRCVCGGVGGDNNVFCTSTHMWCNISVRSLAFHALPHIRPATLLSILLHFHTYVMLRCRYSCTSTHVSCYAAVDSLALPHIRHATL